MKIYTQGIYTFRRKTLFPESYWNFLAGQTEEMNTIIPPGSQSSQILDLTTFLQNTLQEKSGIFKNERKIGKKR